MRFIRQTIDYVKRVLTSPAHELTRWQLALKYTIDLGWHCAKALRHDKATQMAAALTYHTLFSLLPTLVLVLLFLGSIRGLEHYSEEFKSSVINFLLPESMLSIEERAPRNEAITQDAPADPKSQTLTPPSSSTPAPTPPPADGPVPVRASTDRDEVADAQAAEVDAKTEYTEARRHMADRIQDTLNALSKVSFGSIGVVGVIAFLYGATSLLETIEKSFNDIYGVGHSRPLGVRIPRYFTLITVGPLFIIAGQVMQQKFMSLIVEETLTSWLAGPLAVLTPLAATWLALFMLYTMMPNARIKVRAAAAGSFVAAGLWLVGKEAFATYVVSAAISTLYGALALLPLFMLWVYITWLIVLFGLELTYTLQHMEGRRFKHEQGKQFDDIMLDPAWLVPIAAHVAEAFENGKTCKVNVLSDTLKIPARAVRKLLTALESAGLVHEVQHPAATVYTLARPADDIPLTRVIDAARTLLPEREGPDADAAPDPAWKFVEDLHAGQVRIAGAQTLADVTRQVMRDHAAQVSAAAPVEAAPPDAVPDADGGGDTSHDDEAVEV
ncbi:MAG: YihY family inner membrane protein [Phycisphaera sp.]|nr:YihY family inner membrane protein [Phycisphaera sp.]